MLRTGCMTASLGSQSVRAECSPLPERNGPEATIHAALISIPRGTTSTLVTREQMESLVTELTGQRGYCPSSGSTPPLGPPRLLSSLLKHWILCVYSAAINMSTTVEFLLGNRSTFSVCIW